MKYLYFVRGGGSIFTGLRNAIVATLLFLISASVVSASPIPDSLQFRILFPVDSSAVRADLFDNDAVLSEFWGAYGELTRNDSVSITGLTICGSASVECNYERNKILANRRALAVYRYLRKYSIPDTAIRNIYTVPAEASMKSILASLPDTLSGIDMSLVRKISDSMGGLQLKQAILNLDNGEEGTVWNWYKDNILAPCRYAQINIYYNRIAGCTVPVQKVKKESVPVAVSQTVLQQPEPEQKPEPVQQPVPEEETECLKSEFRLGTNLLYDVATVANLYFEAGFARHLALNISATFSPWDIRRPDIKFRTLLVQPELRWYFGNNFKGHYLGVEGHYGWWNVAVGGKTRYQDRDGNTPLWGAGLSYGYVLAFNEHLGMDFGISAGYAKLNYDCFYNIENGAKFTTRTRDWWGPTRLGISIYYQF